MSFIALMIISIVIIIIITVGTIIATNSAYKYEHKVDPIPKDNQDSSQNNKHDN